MPEESTTPDLVELTHRAIEAAGRRDLDAATSFYTQDSVWRPYTDRAEALKAAGLEG